MRIKKTWPIIPQSILTLFELDEATHGDAISTSVTNHPSKLFLIKPVKIVGGFEMFFWLI